MAKGKLSERQEKIIAFINEFTVAKGYPPTIRQIGEAVKISSTSVVNYNLSKLEKDGYIIRDQNTSRGVRLSPQIAQTFQVTPERETPHLRIPVAGYIFASAPVLVGDTAQTSPDEVLELTRDLIAGDTKDLYALRVKGDSMVDAMVNEGDIVVVKKTNRARNGEMVAVWLNDRHETTLKHFYQENGGRVRLQPANPRLQPIYIEDPSVVQVQGRVVLVLRQM